MCGWMVLTDSLLSSLVLRLGLNKLFECSRQGALLLHYYYCWQCNGNPIAHAQVSYLACISDIGCYRYWIVRSDTSFDLPPFLICVDLAFPPVTVTYAYFSIVHQKWTSTFPLNSLQRLLASNSYIPQSYTTLWPDQHSPLKLDQCHVTMTIIQIGRACNDPT